MKPFICRNSYGNWTLKYNYDQKLNDQQILKITCKQFKEVHFKPRFQILN